MIIAGEVCMAGVSITTRFDDGAVGTLDEFCRQSRRDRADVIRYAVELLLADGYEAAEMRLAHHIWDAAKAKEGDVVVAMREEYPASGGRRLVVYTPVGWKGSEEHLKQQVVEAAQAGNLSVEEAREARLDKLDEGLSKALGTPRQRGPRKGQQPSTPRRKKAGG